MITELRTLADVRKLEQTLASDFLRVRPTPVLKQAIKDLEKLHQGYFESDVGPGGNRWEALRPATIARKGHADILEDTLAMRNAVTQTSAAGAVRDVFDEGFNAGLAFGLDDAEIPYWKYHDQGEGRMYRPFIGIVDAELTVIAERLLDHKLQGMVDANNN